MVWPVGFMPPCSLTVSAAVWGPRPAPIRQSRQSRGRPSNTKCLINLLICCDCRAWKACFLAIWGQENRVPCYLHTHTHCYLLCGLLSCCGGIKTDLPLITFMNAPPGDKHLTGHWISNAKRTVEHNYLLKLKSRARTSMTFHLFHW